MADQESPEPVPVYGAAPSSASSASLTQKFGRINFTPQQLLDKLLDKLKDQTRRSGEAFWDSFLPVLT
jgi:hypothetical protein